MIERDLRGWTEPHIKWKHVDGPMMSRRDGTIAWLTWKERFMMWIGAWDVYDVERHTYKRGMS